MKKNLKSKYFSFFEKKKKSDASNQIFAAKANL